MKKKPTKPKKRAKPTLVQAIVPMQETVKSVQDLPDKPVFSLTLEEIKKYINPNVSDQEAYMFLQLCKSQNLNPFINEAYLIKYNKSEYERATMVVGKDVFTKRAYREPQFDGFQAGIIIQDVKEPIYRQGSCIIGKEVLLGGWAEVFRKDRSKAVRAEVSLSEYQRYKKDGSLQRSWSEMPATMIRKVALVQALRETFPETFQGLYDEAEMPVQENPNQKQTESKKLLPAKEPEAKKQESVKTEKIYTLPKEITEESFCEFGKYAGTKTKYISIPLYELSVLRMKSVNPEALDKVLNLIIDAKLMELQQALQMSDDLLLGSIKMCLNKKTIDTIDEAIKVISYLSNVLKKKTGDK